jgi:hypothetical protein
MLLKERAVTGRIFQAMPNFCPHRQTGTLNMKTTSCSHGFKIFRPGQTDRLTELIYKIGKIRFNSLNLTKKLLIKWKKSTEFTTHKIEKRRKG